jgi:hypothetical protein
MRRKSRNEVTVIEVVRTEEVNVNLTERGFLAYQSKV